MFLMATDTPAAASGAPWWGVPLVVLLSFLFGQLSSFVMQERKTRNDDKRRFHRELHAACSRTLTLAGRVRSRNKNDDPNVALDELEQLQSCLDELRLIAPQALSDATPAFVTQAFAIKNGDADATSETFNKALEEFVKQARLVLRPENGRNHRGR
jgi:hypothetical protein